jgi:signal transduction histidine kinase
LGNELSSIKKILDQKRYQDLPQSAWLKVFLQSQAESTPIPEMLTALPAGDHHDIWIDSKFYHTVVHPYKSDTIYLMYDITEIEASEELLNMILLLAWIIMIVLVLALSVVISRSLGRPVARLNDVLNHLDPDQRGIQISQQFSDDEVGRIAQAFDRYLLRIDKYVEKQMAFAAMASHELRSPMTIVQTSADLIAVQHDDEMTRSQVEKIQRAIRGMTDMVEALLEVTRDQPSDLRKQPVLLQPLITEVLNPLQPEIMRKNIQVQNDVPVDLKIETDAVLITVVCTNLIKNALKHGSNSDITITWEDQTLVIRDTGYGIPNQELRHIFDLAHKSSSSTGYGIGLYVSKLVCDHQGWSLTLSQNRPGGIRAAVGLV